MKGRWRVLVRFMVIAIVAAVSAWVFFRPAVRFSADGKHENTLRVVTWNVGYFTPITNKNMREVDIEEVSKVLRETRADVAILQELGTVEQAQRIASKLGPDWGAYSVKTGHGAQVVSILSKLTRLTVVEEEKVLCGGRYAKGVTMHEERSGKKVYLIGLHSPHPVRGMDDTVASISDAVKHAAMKDAEVKLVAGDLNYHFRRGSEDDLYAEIMNDFGDGTRAIGKTYYAQTRIDHVFHFPKELEVIEGESGMVDLDFRFAKVPSFRDHRPIVVTYQF